VQEKTTTKQRKIAVAFPFLIIFPRLEAKVVQAKGLD
jgi:hypothetical protein